LSFLKNIMKHTEEPKNAHLCGMFKINISTCDIYNEFINLNNEIVVTLHLATKIPNFQRLVQDSTLR
jgi:hypothetical protein